MNIAIVGAGLIGRMCAWQLSHAPHINKITLFDKDTHHGSQSSAWVAAAMLAPMSESLHAPASIYNMGRHALELWPTIISSLERQTQQTIFSQHNGSLVIAHSQDTPLLNQFYSRLKDNTQIKNNEVERLSRAQLLQQAPCLQKNFTQALHLHKEGSLDNRQLLNSLYIYLKQQAHVLWKEQTEITNITTGQVSYNTPGNRSHSETFDTVIDCRGAGATHTTDNLRGVRGEIIWVRAPEVDLQHAIRLMHPRYQLYIAPHGNHTFAIGATEIESSDEKNITVRSSLELLSALYSVSSKFSEAEILGSYARLRPAYSNNLPRIDLQEGLIKINGLYRHGYLLAPIISHDIYQHITSSPNNILWPDIMHSASRIQNIGYTQ